MIDVDGNIVDQTEIVVVTKIMATVTNSTASVGFQIAMKGGYHFAISRSVEAYSDNVRKQEIDSKGQEIAKIRDWVLANIDGMR